MKIRRDSAGLIGRVVDALLRVDDQPEQRRLRPGGDGALLSLPVGVAVAVAQQVLGLTLYPLGADRADGARPELGGLGDLGGHDPLRSLPNSAEPGRSTGGGCACRGSPACRSSSRRWRAAPSAARGARSRRRLRRRDRQLQLPGEPLELAAHVHPLEHAQGGEEALAAHLPEPRVRQRSPLCTVEEAPEVQPREEVRTTRRRTRRAARRPPRASRTGARAGPAPTAR